jgi:hypothetical protein
MARVRKAKSAADRRAHSRCSTMASVAFILKMFDVNMFVGGGLKGRLS